MKTGILKRATDAKERTDIAQIQEEIQIAWNGVQAEGIPQNWELEDKRKALEEELQNQDGNAIVTVSDPNVLVKNYKGYDATINTTTGSITSLAKSGAGGSQPQTDPSVEYGYAESNKKVPASELAPGDLINYYYKDKNGTKQTIPCVVMYGSNSEQGLQVISVDTVGENVILGFNNTNQDPKAIAAFADKNEDGVEDAPEGYTVSNFEKARWSYNHAIATLNERAQDYIGSMAESARCVGAPKDNIVKVETETANTMFTANESYTYFTNYNGKFKNADPNIIGGFTSEDGSAQNISLDLKTMDTLGIVQTDNNYWLASRNINSDSSYSSFIVSNVHERILDNCYWDLCSVDSGSTYENGYSLGFRPIFTLKSNIQVEKTGHLENDRGTGGFYSEPQE